MWFDESGRYEEGMAVGLLLVKLQVRKTGSFEPETFLKDIQRHRVTICHLRQDEFHAHVSHVSLR